MNYQEKMLEEEKQHLVQVKEALNLAFNNADDYVMRLDRDYREAKQYMVDYHNEMDSHEKLQNEKLLDQTDRAGVFAVGSRDKISKLMDSPYFARIDFSPAGDDEAYPYYIGKFGFSHDGEQMIFDWRAPISGVFYDYDVGPAGFDAPVGRIDGQLTRKRQFKIEKGEIEYALETQTGIQDDVLQKELAHTSDEKMKSIIMTIQREQNAIIRNERAENLIIQGVAGSGKTSIALHRIAFLLYRFKNQINAQDVLIISPNKVFADYISNVIPELGEEPVAECSFEDIARKKLDGIISFETGKNPLEIKDTKWHERARFKSTQEFVRLLEDYVSHMPERIFASNDYSFGGYTISGDWIRERFIHYSSMPVKRRLSYVAEDIRSLLGSHMSMWHEPPKAGAVVKELNKMLTVKNTPALYKDFFKYIKATKMLVFPDKNTLEWEDVFPFIYVMAAFDGIPENRDVKHLVIDEMQDYTPIQYVVLNMMCPCKKTILGDFGQMLNPCHSHTLDDLRGIYEDAEFVALNRSYRSTCEIMSFAKTICNQPHLEMVERHGPQPEVVGCKDKKAEEALINEEIERFREGEYASMGIVTKTNEEAEKLYESLSQKCRINLLTSESTEFSAGITVTSVQMAKGLEFDQILVPDASETQYCNEYDRNLLYIACTRAMHELTLTYIGNPSKFIPGK